MPKLEITATKPSKEWGKTVFEITKNGKFVGYAKAPNGKRKSS